jgi:hypothetical protein
MAFCHTAINICIINALKLTVAILAGGCGFSPRIDSRGQLRGQSINNHNINMMDDIGKLAHLVLDRWARTATKTRKGT